MDARLDRVNAKLHFDNYPSRLRTLDEALDCVQQVNFRDTDFTDRQVIVFCEKGYLYWNLDKDRKVKNYSPRAELYPYSSGVNDFVRDRVRDTNLILMIPMDVLSLQVIQEADGDFDEQARWSHLGVPKHIGLKHSFQSYSSYGGNGERERLGLER